MDDLHIYTTTHLFYLQYRKIFILSKYAESPLSEEITVCHYWNTARTKQNYTKHKNLHQIRDKTHTTKPSSMEVAHTLIMLSARCSSLSAIHPVTSGSATRWLCWRNNISSFLRSPNGGKKLIWLSARSSLRRTGISYITWTFHQRTRGMLSLWSKLTAKLLPSFMNTVSGTNGHWVTKRPLVSMRHFYMCQYISTNI